MERGLRLTLTMISTAISAKFHAFYRGLHASRRAGVSSAMLGVAWADMILIGGRDKPSEQKIEGALHLSRLERLYKTYHPSPIAIIIIEQLTASQLLSTFLLITPSSFTTQTSSSSQHQDEAFHHSLRLHCGSHCLSSTYYGT